MKHYVIYTVDLENNSKYLPRRNVNEVWDQMIFDYPNFDEWYDIWYQVDPNIKVVRDVNAYNTERDYITCGLLFETEVEKFTFILKYS